ncbi:hypothetical protein FB45DRAFT_913201 [Roridomyces roridus]|uniref:Uncharacterized protein n=1 Tax=Roridomyces roridus TaxID=1738132 RepID=A0AAD7BX15_9AGAR|nr:hypothetical protein FB45DRAFT_913201 [Roridomyces roridus]
MYRAALPYTLGEKPTTMKPQPGTYRVTIPNDNHFIRIFPGGTTVEHEFYFLDFCRTSTKTPVDTPAGYVLRFEGEEDPMDSMETGYLKGMPGSKFAPGMEKYTVNDGTRICLQRPDRDEFLFDVPSRVGPQRAAQPGVGQPVPM